MDETEFWEIVDSTREASDDDPEEHADLMVERLAGLDPDAVLDFARHFETRFNRAFSWDLWGAADIMLGGADEDAFDFFRCWLIGQGRHVFEGALHSPTTWPSWYRSSTRRRTATPRTWGTPPTRRTSS